MVESVLICAFLARVLAHFMKLKLSKTKWFLATVFMVIIWHMTLKYSSYLIALLQMVWDSLRG